MARGRIEISLDTCKGCDLCIDACPHGVIEIGDYVNKKGYLAAEAKHLENCTGCTFCALMCPDSCITVYRFKGGEAN